MSGRLRVVYLDHCARLSGAELALARLLPALVPSVDPHVILAEDGPLTTKLDAMGITTEVLPMAEVARGLTRDKVHPSRLPAASLLCSAGHTVTLARRLRSLRPDLVHTNSLKAGVYGSVAARLARVPVIWHVRDRISNDYLPPAAVALVRIMARRLPAAVVANSRSTLETVAAPGLTARIISSPVQTELFARQQRQSQRLRIGMVGRLAPWKGQHVFLEAFATAFPNGEADGVIVGDALFAEVKYKQALHEQVRALGLDGRVEMIGFRDDVAGELAKMDVLVHASVIPEPFGQVVVEGMAAGLAVIAAGAGGPAEVIRHEHDGLLYRSGDAAALARSMRRLAGDPALRERLGQAARLRADEFTPDVVAEQVMDLYRLVLGTSADAGMVETRPSDPGPAFERSTLPAISSQGTGEDELPS